MIGKTISQYKILEEIGAGGMGVVFKAEDTKLKRTVALKFLPPEFSRDKEAKDRFFHEARASATLDHPNICAVYEINETDDGQLFMAMAYYEGETLKDRIKPEGVQHAVPLPIDKAIDITLQIAEGLKKAHQKDIVHRDIKSANIIVTHDDVVKILDFGLAKLKGTTKLTKEGTTLGTVDYMSPEQAAGEIVDHRSDIWSLGVVLYETVTGQLPFKGEYEQAIMYAIMNEEPEPVTGLRTGIPMELERIINKTLAKDPNERYQGTADLLVDLKKVKKDSQPEITPSRKKTSPEITLKTSRKTLALGILFLATIIIGAYFIFKGKVEPEIPPVGPGNMPSLAIVYFENKSGDETLDNWRDAFSELLTTDLSQSKYIKVLRSDENYGIFKKLNLLEAKRYSTQDLQNIAEKGKVNHILRGSYIKDEDNFVITTMLLRADTGETISSLSVRAKKGEIFSNIDNITREIKSKLNLSKNQISGDIDKEISQITTSYPEALQYYLEGRRYVELGELRKSITCMEKALKIDPEFAMAYRSMALAYMNLGYAYECHKYREKAMQLSHRLPNRERFIIQADYYKRSEKTWDKAIEAYQKVLQLYPLDHMANASLGRMYGHLEDWDKAIERYEVLVRNKSESVYSYSDLSMYYQSKGLYEKAGEILEYYLKHFQDHWIIRVSLAGNYCLQKKFDRALVEAEKAIPLAPNLYQPYAMKFEIYFYEGNFIKAEEALQKALELPEKAPSVFGLLVVGYLYITEGRFAEAEAQYRQALIMAKEINLKYFGNLPINDIGYVYFIRGKFEEYLKEFCQNWFIANDKRGLYFTAMAYLEKKSLAQAEKAEAELGEWINNRMNKKLIRWYYLFKGQKELKKKNHSKAIEYFNKAVSLLRYEYSRVNGNIAGYHPLFFDALARAYLESGNLEKAQNLFEKITTLTFGRYRTGDIYAKAFYHLGKIYQQKEFKGKAIDNYNIFINLWKNCDPIFQPLVEDAKEQVKILESGV